MMQLVVIKLILFFIDSKIYLIFALAGVETEYDCIKVPLFSTPAEGPEYRYRNKIKLTYIDISKKQHTCLFSS